MADDTPMNDLPRVRNYGPRIRLAVIVGIVTIIAVLLIVALSPRGPMGRAAQTKEVAASGRAVLTLCLVYAAENENKYPPHLAALVARGMDTKFLVAPSGVPMTRPAGETDWRILAPAVDAHCDFTYAGAGVKGSDPPTVIVLYSKPEVLPGGRVVGFVDGHIEFIKDADLAVIFDQNNTAREENRRPRIMLDAAGNIANLSINPA